MSLRCSSKKGIINFKYFDVLELGWCLLPAVEDESAAQVRKGNFNLAFPLILLVSKELDLLSECRYLVGQKV